MELVSEADKGMLDAGKLIAGMWVGIYQYQMFCGTTAKKESQTRTENQTRFGRSAFEKGLSPSHSKEYNRASMHWGVACVTALVLMCTR